MHDAKMSFLAVVEIDGDPDDKFENQGAFDISRLAVEIEDLSRHGFTFTARRNKGDDYVALGSEEQEADLELMDRCEELYRLIMQRKDLDEAYKHPHEAVFRILYGHVDVMDVRPYGSAEDARIENLVFDCDGGISLISDDGYETDPENIPEPF